MVDLLASAKLMGFGLSTNWEMELLRADLVRAAGPSGRRGWSRSTRARTRSSTSPGDVVRGRAASTSPRRSRP